LVELLCATVLVAAAIAVLAPIAARLLGDAPRALRAVEGSSRLGEFVDRLRGDVNAARSLTANDKRLEIVTDEGRVRYELLADGVSRRRVVDGPPAGRGEGRGRGAEQREESWRGEGCRAAWRVHTSGGRIRGVEVRTWVEQWGETPHPDRSQSDGGLKPRRKLANACVLFMGATPGRQVAR
jgi:hypothetical protein